MILPERLYCLLLMQEDRSFLFIYLFIKNPPEDMFIDFTDSDTERERQRETERGINVTEKH